MILPPCQVSLAPAAAALERADPSTGVPRDTPPAMPPAISEGGSAAGNAPAPPLALMAGASSSRLEARSLWVEEHAATASAERPASKRMRGVEQELCRARIESRV